MTKTEALAEFGEEMAPIARQILFHIEPMTVSTADQKTENVLDVSANRSVSQTVEHAASVSAQDGLAHVPLGLNQTERVVT